ncbi:MAG: hypothetical protein EBS07_12090 [Sphingobacteriia bacterium]|nr:hypothetical protein [Sphingobacteriia bacterium]
MSGDLQIREQIQRYVKGEMDSREAHAFEVKMLSDPFLSDAVEGWAKADEIEFTRVWSPQGSLQSKKNPSANRLERYRMVAGLALLVGMGALVWILSRPSIPQNESNRQFETHIQDPSQSIQKPRETTPVIENTQTLNHRLLAEGSTPQEDLYPPSQKSITQEESAGMNSQRLDVSSLATDNTEQTSENSNSYHSDTKVSPTAPLTTAGSEKKNVPINPDQKWYSWVGGSSSATEPKSTNERTTEKSVSTTSPIPDLIRSGNLVSAQQQLKSLNKKEIDPLLYLKYQAYLAWKSGNMREANDWLRKIDKKYPGQTKGLLLNIKL